MYVGDNPLVEFSKKEYRGLDWSCTGREVKSDEGLVDGGSGNLTKDDHFFVNGVTRPLLRNIKGA